MMAFFLCSLMILKNTLKLFKYAIARITLNTLLFNSNNKSIRLLLTIYQHNNNNNNNYNNHNIILLNLILPSMKKIEITLFLLFKNQKDYSMLIKSTSIQELELFFVGLGIMSKIGFFFVRGRRIKIARFG